MSQTVAGLLRPRAADDRAGLCHGDAVWTWREIVGACAARAAWMRAVRTARPRPEPRGRGDLAPKWVPRHARVTGDLPATAPDKVLRRRLAAEARHTGDPVWWRPGREPRFTPMTAGDVDRLRAEFERRGRAHLWPRGDGATRTGGIRSAAGAARGPRGAHGLRPG